MPEAADINYPISHLPYARPGKVLARPMRLRHTEGHKSRLKGIADAEAFAKSIAPKAQP